MAHAGMAAHANSNSNRRPLSHLPPCRSAPMEESEALATPGCRCWRRWQRPARNRVCWTLCVQCIARVCVSGSAGGRVFVVVEYHAMPPEQAPRTGLAESPCTLLSFPSMPIRILLLIARSPSVCLFLRSVLSLPELSHCTPIHSPPTRHTHTYSSSISTVASQPARSILAWHTP